MGNGDAYNPANLAKARDLARRSKSDAVRLVNALSDFIPPYCRVRATEILAEAMLKQGYHLVHTGRLNLETLSAIGAKPVRYPGGRPHGDKSHDDAQPDDGQRAAPAESGPHLTQAARQHHEEGQAAETFVSRPVRSQWR